MTIIIGTIYQGTVYMGTDSLWTWDDHFVRVHKSSKFADFSDDNVLVATSGHDKFTLLLEKAIRSEPRLLEFKDKKGVIQLVDAIQDLAHKHGVGEPEANSLPNHDLGFLMASVRTNKLWAVESDYGVTEFDDYVCMGIGSHLGESAMRALSKQGIHGEVAVRTAIETVNELHPYCGGPIEIRTLKLKAGKNG